MPVLMIATYNEDGSNELKLQNRFQGVFIKK